MTDSAHNGMDYDRSLANTVNDSFKNTAGDDSEGLSITNEQISDAYTAGTSDGFVQLKNKTVTLI